MMKILISLLLVFSPFAQADDKPVNLLETKVTFNGVDVRVSEVFDFLGESLKTPPNVVFKGEAGEHQVSSLKVKDVTLGNLFRVLESIADVEIEIIEDHGYLKGGAGDDPFAPTVKTKVLTNSGIVVISSLRKAGPTPLASIAPAKVLPPKRELTTEVIPVKELGLPIDSLIDVITTTWRGIDGDLAGQASIAYHEPTKLLIITAPKHGLEIAQKILGALMPDYQRKLDDKHLSPRLLPGVPPGSPQPVNRIPKLVPSNIPKGTPLPVPNQVRPRGVPVTPGVEVPNPDDLTPAPRVIPLPGTAKPIPIPKKPAVPSDDPFGN